MTNQAKSGLGLSVICGTTIYGEVTNADSPTSTMSKTDTTTHNNVGSVKTSRPAWIENGEMSVEMNYIGSTAQDALLAMYYAKTVSTWYVVAPMSIGRAWSFSGYLAGLPVPKFDKEGNATMSFKVQATGIINQLTTSAAGLTTPFLSVTDQGSTSLTLAPAAATATYGYTVTADLADTGVKVTATAAVGTIYIDNTLTATGVASAAITLGTSAGDVIAIPVVVFDTSAKVQKIYWIEATHGYV